MCTVKTWHFQVSQPATNTIHKTLFQILMRQFLWKCKGYTLQEHPQICTSAWLAITVQNTTIRVFIKFTTLRGKILSTKWNVQVQHCLQIDVRLHGTVREELQLLSVFDFHVRKTCSSSSKARTLHSILFDKHPPINTKAPHGKEG